VGKLSVQSGLREAQRQEGLFYRLYLDENAEYFGTFPPVTHLAPSLDVMVLTVSCAALAVMWFFTTPIYLALIPYFIYSIFHVITYFSEYVLPAITARPARPKEDKLAQLAHKYQDLGSQTVAKVEVYGILIRLIVAILM